MLIHSYIVLFLFAMLAIALFERIMSLREVKPDLLGTPPIDKYLFIAGKITLVTNWGFFIYKAIFPATGYISVPAPLSWVATILLLLGTLIIILAIYNLGTSLKVGLPVEVPQLKTNGIYAFSRNPLYLGGYLITIGSCIYFPDLINISFGLFAVIIHHLIILAEEKCLNEKLGDQWRYYREKTRRYF
jgi:protein-S-isoprenylcysteine O-methyltransferase Ste14